MSLRVTTVNLSHNGGIMETPERVVQVAEVNGHLGTSSFTYDEKLTLSPFNAQVLMLDLAVTLQEDFGFDVTSDDSVLMASLRSAKKGE